MKTYSFDICKCHVTITIEKRKYEVIDRLEMAKDLVKSQPVKEKGCPPDYNGGFCADYDVDCDACWEEYTSTTNEKPTEEIKMEEPEDLCFLEAAERYIAAQLGVLAPSTIKGYQNIIEKHLSSIWLIWLDRLTEDHLQEAFDQEIAKGLSVRTLKGYRSLVLKILAEYRPDFHPNIRVTKEDVDETAKA